MQLISRTLNIAAIFISVCGLTACKVDDLTGCQGNQAFDNKQLLLFAEVRSTADGAALKNKQIQIKIVSKSTILDGSPETINATVNTGSDGVNGQTTVSVKDANSYNKDRTARLLQSGEVSISGIVDGKPVGLSKVLLENPKNTCESYTGKAEDLLFKVHMTFALDKPPGAVALKLDQFVPQILMFGASQKFQAFFGSKARTEKVATGSSKPGVLKPAQAPDSGSPRALSAE